MLLLSFVSKGQNIIALETLRWCILKGQFGQKSDFSKIGYVKVYGNRCSLKRDIARSHFFEQHKVIRLVDTFLFDEFDWLIVL